MLRKIKTFFVLAIIASIVFAIYFTYSLFQPASQEVKLVYFPVASGQGLKQIANNLKEQGLIRNKFIFEFYVWLRSAQAKLLAGEHKLSADMSIREVLKTLTTGDSIKNEKKITIIEGWRSEEIGDYLEKQRLVSKAEFLAAIKIADWRVQYDFLAEVRAETVEGFLFPDTYRVFTKASAQEIVKKMLDNFGRQLTTEMREDVKQRGKNILAVVILASIVEREARTEEDQKMVADIFLKRLALNIGLQSDATINYITGKKDLRPSAADLKLDSPYNTYKYRGLPPGPIANPGLQAIKAVIYPIKNDYYYFLMDQDGQTHYGKIYSEHQENIRKFLN